MQRRPIRPDVSEINVTLGWRRAASVLAAFVRALPACFFRAEERKERVVHFRWSSFRDGDTRLRDSLQAVVHITTAALVDGDGRQKHAREWGKKHGEEVETSHFDSDGSDSPLNAAGDIQFGVQHGAKHGLLS